MELSEHQVVSLALMRSALPVLPFLGLELLISYNLLDDYGFFELNNSKIIRNRLKIQSSINNAKRFLEVQNEFDSFSNYIWDFTNNYPIINTWKKSIDIPCESKLSRTISKDLKKRGFQFFGPTITYSFMQAAGLINDHTINCSFK